MENRTLKTIKCDIDRISLLKSKLEEEFFSFLKAEDVSNIKVSLVKKNTELENERMLFIEKSKSIGKTYAESLGLENINWRSLLAGASSEEDWKKLEELAKNINTHPVSLFDSRYPRYDHTEEYYDVYEGMPANRDISQQGNLFYQHIRKRDKHWARYAFDSMMKDYVETKNPGWIDIPVFQEPEPVFIER